jgi:hypothetical protein
MKKLLLLLASVMLLATSCSSDDNDERGYLTDLENVKHGLIGTWGISYPIEYDVTFNGTILVIEMEDIELTIPYSVIMEDGKFYIVTEQEKEDENGNIIGTETVKAEIRVLNERKLTLYSEEYDVTDNYVRLIVIN